MKPILAPSTVSGSAASLDSKWRTVPFFFICPGQLLKDSSTQGRSLACRRLQEASGRCNLGNWGSSGLVEGLSFLRGRRERPPPGVSRVGMGLCAIGGGRAMQTDFRSSRQHQPHIPSGWYGVCTCTSPHSFLPSFSPRATLLVATVTRGNRDPAGSRSHGAMCALVRGQQKGGGSHRPELSLVSISPPPR